MTFAELVIKFKSDGNDKVLNDVRSIEVELKKVSNASINAANRVSVSFQRIGQASSRFQGLQNFGQTINQQFQQASASAIPFGQNILDLVQSFALLRNASSKTIGERAIVSLFDIFGKLRSAVNNTNLGMMKFFSGLDRDSPKLKIFGTIAGKAGENFLKMSEYFTKILPSVQAFSVKFAISIENFLSFAGMDVVLSLGIVAGLTAIATATVAMNLAIARSTVEAAFNFEQLQARLSALTTPEKATDILSFVRKLAEPSNFTTQQLAESSVQLEAFGLNSKRILPIMAQLGMAFGADAEKLRLLTDMFGRLSQGQLPDAQVMAQFGLSKSKLMKEGIKFDNQGSLVSSTREVMIAIEKIVTRDYGKIFDKMANTGNAKLASLTDVFERLKISVGMQLAETAKGAITSFTNVLIAIEKTGIIERAAKSMLLPFEALAKLLGGEGQTGIFSNAQIMIASFAGTLIAGFEELNIQTALFLEQLGRVYELLINPKGLTGVAYIQNIGKILKDIGKGTTGQFAPSRMIKKGTDYSEAILGQMFMGGPATNIKDLLDLGKLGDFGKLEDLLKPDKAAKEKNQRTLDLIQQNTKTQNEITLRNLTYGGGELAAQGLSAVQMSGFRSVSSPGINASNDIVRGVEKIVRGYSNSNNLNFSFKRS